MRAARLVFAALLLAGCRSPAHPESVVELDTGQGAVLGVSTELGLMVLTDSLAPDLDHFQFDYRVGNGRFRDIADIERKSEVLTVLTPRSSRPNHARLAAEPALPQEPLFIEVRTEGGEPSLVPCELYDGGRAGDLLAPFGDSPYRLATEYLGAPIYALRQGYYQLVGILNGVYGDVPAVLAFVGIDEIFRAAPDGINFFERRALELRLDFEYGIPREIEGEATFATDLPKSEAGTDEPDGPPEEER